MKWWAGKRGSKDEYANWSMGEGSSGLFDCKPFPIGDLAGLVVEEINNHKELRTINFFYLIK